MKKLGIILATIGFVIVLALPAGAMRASAAGDILWPSFTSTLDWESAVDALLLPASRKISAQVWDTLDQETTADTLVLLKAQADLEAASTFSTKEARGRYVYTSRYELAQRTQAPLRAHLDALEMSYKTFYIINAIQVRGDRELLLSLALHPEVTRVIANPHVSTSLPDLEATPLKPLAVNAVEWNISRVGAPDVWAMGYTGQGIVIAGQDTGYAWEHTALQSHYRGAQSATVNHNYNWHDAIHSGGGSCGADAIQPCDDHGHGTHTMGTMVGDDGGVNQVGMAPDAQWIGCRNMDVGYGTPARYIECFEFFLAPYPIGETPDDGNADPAMAPDVINNSWSCPPSEGCDWQSLQEVVNATYAAGILVVSSASNYGSACSTVREPASIYETAYSVGATDSNEAIASLSSRGPVIVDGSGRLKPDISAPGISVRSSTRNGSYGSLSGTSMASPHVAGAAALLWSARPDLRGHLDETTAILNASAVPYYSTQCGDPADTVPNNVFGWGRLDIAAAVDLGINTGFLVGDVRTTSGDPLPGDGLQITLTGGKELHTSTNSSGAFRSLVVSGTYTVNATLPGYLPLTVSDVRVTAQQTTTLPLTLTCDTITGTSFIATPQEPWAGTPVTFTAMTTGGGAPITFTWQISNEPAQVGQIVTHTFSAQDEPMTTYPISLTAHNACSQQTITESISVRNPVTPCDEIAGTRFDHTPQAPWADTPITLTGAITQGTLPVTFTWQIGDESARVGNPITYTFPVQNEPTSTYPITLTAHNVCSQQTVTGHISVHNPFTPCDTLDGVSFSYVPQEPQQDAPVLFTATVLTGSMPMTYQWNFGDGSGLFEGNPITHTFQAGSSMVMAYRVSVFVTNPCDQKTYAEDVFTFRYWRVYLPLVLR